MNWLESFASTWRAGIHFEWLWVFWLLPMPVLIYLLLKPLSAQFAALRVPFFDLVSTAKQSQGQQQRWLWWLAGLLWVFLLLATARPQWVGEAIISPQSGRDLMLAVDLSDSMKERDMVIKRQRVNRLQAVQLIAGDFITQREGDRLGLILFGSEAYLQSPLTMDRRTVKTLLNEAVIGIAGGRTAIGDAIALAVKRLQGREKGDKVLILLTDGENNAGSFTPGQAVQLAVKTGLKVHTIGIGSNRLRGIISGGGPVDERALTQIAEATGGRYFRAQDTQQLAKIYALIDQLETVEEQQQSLRPIRELFFLPAALAYAFGGLLFFFRRRWAA